MHASKDRSPKPGGTAAANNATKGISVSAPVQRIIKFGPTKKFGKGIPEINDIKTLESAIAETFPRFKLQFITDRLDEIKRDGQTWSLAEIHTHFSGEHKKLPPKDITQEFNGDIRLPEKPNDQKNFLFTTRTRLNAKVKVGEKNYYTPEYTQSDKEHAEEHLKAYLEAEKLALSYLAEGFPEDPYGVEFSLLYTVARLKAMKGEEDAALMYFQKALQCSTRASDLLAYTYYRIAQIAKRKKDDVLFQWACVNAVKADELNEGKDDMKGMVRLLN